MRRAMMEMDAGVNSPRLFYGQPLAFWAECDMEKGE
jgi:hypothetical protein